MAHLITRLDIYGDGDTAPRDSILFTDAGKAEDARVKLLADDGMAGIDRIEVVTAPTDANAVADFYMRQIDTDNVDWDAYRDRMRVRAHDTARDMFLRRADGSIYGTRSR